MNKKGFTLIELMIVVAIIGILAAVAVPKFMELSAASDLKKQGFNTTEVFTWLKENSVETEGMPYRTFLKSKKLQREFRDGASVFNKRPSPFSETRSCNCSCNK